MGYDASYGKYMDHTVLKSNTTEEVIKKFCDEAKVYGFASVCVNPCHVPFVHEQLKGTNVKTCCVIGFPLGANTSLVKQVETMDAVSNGAQEVDMVINIGALIDKQYEIVKKDIEAVVKAAHPYAIVKVIIETCYLSDEEKKIACRIANEANADFVKTSTGFGNAGASVEDIKLMKECVPNMHIKASTGINSREICDAMLKAGATRMGTSKGIFIVKDKEAV